MARRLFLTSRQTNLMLEVAMVTVIASGLISWTVPLSSARWVTVIHAVSGLFVLAIAPFKVRGSARTGFKRKSRTRFASASFGVMVVGAIVAGVIHSTGVLFATGSLSPLWFHLFFGLLAIPVLVWHVWTRPVRPKPIDLTRRGVITASVGGAIAATALGVQEVALDSTEARGSDRAGTGSIEIASFDPGNMPQVSWFDDQIPTGVAAPLWPLRIGGAMVNVVEDLMPATRQIQARIDCTGGWYSVQDWDVVSLSELIEPNATARSVRVRSVTGYARLFPIEYLDDLFLATGYGGEPLRVGHGAPVRLVAPNRRGFNWVKWVREIELSDRPAWLQSPFPLS